MRILVSTIALCVATTAAFGQKILSTNPLAMEDYKTIEELTLEIARLNLESEPHGFSKKVQKLSKDERFITFMLSGNSINYYKNGSGKQFIYSCKFNNPLAISSLIPFLAKERRALIPNKYLKSDKIRIEDTAGFYELDIVFSGSKIKQVIYTTHPD
jgi:hypothetical protein